MMMWSDSANKQIYVSELGDFQYSDYNDVLNGLWNGRGWMKWLEAVQQQVFGRSEKAVMSDEGQTV
jgi:hypothetical protein